LFGRTDRVLHIGADV